MTEDLVFCGRCGAAMRYSHRENVEIEGDLLEIDVWKCDKCRNRLYR